ncbi:MAG: efflux RND transporter periplasmic adaptor subunit [Parvibaculaceae bacterium]|nr:efflux RND transporter periplasmic adaptor subunit [Parvibaculaceae bacterium]
MTVESQNPNNPAAPRKSRLPLPLILLGIAIIGGIAWGAHYYFIDRFYETTDDAYVNGNMVNVASQVSGTVTTVHVANTQYVKEGDVLLELDPTDAQVALDKAVADLGQTVRTVAHAFRVVDVDRANLQYQQTQVVRAKQDLARAMKLAPVNGVSKETLEHTRVDLAAAETSLAQAQTQLNADASLVTGTSVADHPQVKAAEADVRNAFIRLARMKIVAPATGIVAQKTILPGDQITPATPLMTLVPLESVWVDANFKETELRDLRLGQPVELTTDLYGSGETYHGKIIGFSAGTGSAFSVLPPQNATGNWIKVVQRLSVRIGLDPEEIRKNPLSIGLSVDVSADVHDLDGKRLSEVPVFAAGTTTQVFSGQTSGADALIEQTVSANQASAQ